VAEEGNVVFVSRRGYGVLGLDVVERRKGRKWFVLAWLGFASLTRGVRVSMTREAAVFLFFLPRVTDWRSCLVLGRGTRARAVVRSNFDSRQKEEWMRER